MQDRHVVYVLQLEQARWYVGKTTTGNLAARVQQHRYGQGAKFPKRYKPLNLDVIISSYHDDEQSAALEETNKTLNLMDIYGIDMVRGAQWTRMDISKETRVEIERYINHLKSRCFECNKSGHFAAECPNQHQRRSPATCPQYKYSYGSGYKRTNLSSHFAAQCPYQDQQHPSVAPQQRTYQEEPIRCFRCYRPGHIAANCYRCGRVGHQAEGCYARTHLSGRPLKNSFATYLFLLTFFLQQCCLILLIVASSSLFSSL